MYALLVKGHDDDDDATVRRFRIRHPGVIDHLGKARDIELAARFGIARSTLQFIRVRLGISRFVEPPEEAIERLHPGMAELLGRRSDQAIADRYGLSHTAVQLWRKRFDIPARRDPITTDFGERMELRHPGITARLGQASDRIVGLEFGLSQSRAAVIRTRLGISRSRRASPVAGRALYEARLEGRTWADVAATQGVRHVPNAMASARRWALGNGLEWPPRVEVR